jgi:hypothetical protein
MNFWLMFSAVFLVAWFLQNIIHEGSHLLAGWIFEGRKPLKMIPWPSIRGGKFYFAYYKCGPRTKEGSAQWRHIAPLFTSWILSPLFLILLVITKNPYFIPFLICSVGNQVNWMWGLIFNRPRTDGFRFLQEK